MRMQMETQVVVETFEEVGMTDPFATNASLEETISYADEVDIDVDEYRNYKRKIVEEE
jgi:hypothetical protein